jgi:lysophospholipase L1-like esterase
VLAIALGLLVAVLLVEVGLRVYALTIHPSVGQLVHEVDRNVDFLIVCAGDSHTEGKGAPRGFDYPSQLAALLDHIDPARRYAVVNLGLAGCNSSEAANRALEFMRRSPRAPDLVIFEAGKNNDHNFKDARIFPELAASRDYREWARYLLSNSRAFRLSQITYRRLEELSHNPNPTLRLDADHFFAVDGAAEQALLVRWMIADLAVLRDATLKRGGKLVLLNYFLEAPWVDQAYRDFVRRSPTALVDIHRFGLGALARMADWSGLIKYPDYHPNARGYARIAQLIYRQLAEQRLLPEKKNAATQ